MREKQGKIRRFALRYIAALTCALERTEVTQQLLCTPSTHIGALQRGTGPQSSSWRKGGEMDPSGSLQFSFPIGQFYPRASGLLFVFNPQMYLLEWFPTHSDSRCFSRCFLLQAHPLQAWPFLLEADRGQWSSQHTELPLGHG